MITIDLTAALHASAPRGYKCADCTMGPEPCPDCYAAWWHVRHPETHLIGSRYGDQLAEERAVRERQARAMQQFVDQRAEAIRRVAYP